MGDCVFFQRPQLMGGVNPDAVGILWYLSLPVMIPGERYDLVRALSPLPCRGVGRHREVPMLYGISLDSARQDHQWEMAFGLAMMWAHPHQAHLPSLDEVVRKLTLLIDIGDNWVYTFVQLNEGTLHVPLSSKGHISAMIDGVPSRGTCGHLHKLQVWKLLQCGSHMA